MNFFQSIFGDESSSSEIVPEPENHSDDVHDDSTSETLDETPEDGDAWTFGGLFKTLTTKSESMVESYRRDLKEFGEGLKKEIEVVQGSLGTVGHAIDEIGHSVIKGTSQIISQGKDVLLTASDESESESSASGGFLNRTVEHRLSSKQYNRLESQILAIQGDPGTYTDEAEDGEDYERWKSGFDLEGKREEMETLLEGNKEMGNLHKKIVPNVVNAEEFWFKYYYKVNKLMVADDIRAKIVRRAISLDEEELSWDVDDEEAVENEAIGDEHASSVNNEEPKAAGEHGKMEEEDSRDEESSKDGEGISAKEDVSRSSVEAGATTHDQSASGGEEARNDDRSEAAEEGARKEIESEEKHDSGGKDVEDLGWDEIEDMSGLEENKGKHGEGSSNIADLRKRLSAAEEEDMSWDIEDDG